MLKSEREKTIESVGFYQSNKAFSDEEFKYIKKSIDAQYTKVIRKEDIPKEKLVEHLKREFKVSHYHEISKYINHSKTWPKSKRILPRDFVNWFLSTRYINELVSQYGSLEITDEELIGYPNIYWRITRPNKKNDVGPLHRDSWFWEINKLNGKDFPKFKRLKSWISINVEAGKNGLLVVKGSHKIDNLKWNTIEKDGKFKPSLETKIPEEKKMLLNTYNNCAVTFDDDLVHGGSENFGETTRVSMEFTVFLKDFKI